MPDQVESDSRIMREDAPFNLGITVPLGVPCVVDQMEASGVSQRLTSVCGCRRYWIEFQSDITSLKLELVYIYTRSGCREGVKRLPHWTCAVSSR